MKKLFALFAILTLAVVLAGCGKKTEYYFAVADEPGNGYIYYAILEKKGDKIVSATWDGYHIDGGEASKCAGVTKADCGSDYGMEARATKGEWNEQAKAVTDWVVENNSLDVTFDADNVAEEISGATIHSKEFFDLAEEALENGPVAKGEFENGFFYVEGDKADKTYTIKKSAVDATVTKDSDADTVVWTETRKAYSFATFIVVNGTIVHADFNAANVNWTTDANGLVELNEAGDAPATKFLTKDVSKDNYGMQKASSLNANGEWYKQAQRIEAFLLENQGLDDVTVKDDNKTDDITNVTMKVNGYVDIWTEAKAEMTAE
jgi:hypothetical protein